MCVPTSILQALEDKLHAVVFTYALHLLHNLSFALKQFPIANVLLQPNLKHTPNVKLHSDW